LHEKEISLREAQAELAHFSRLSTMGELAASIVHEINQPLAGNSLFRFPTIMMPSGALALRQRTPLLRVS
jgi:C4-dicarboxylate-specific signal transduction histidine kinase